MKKAKESTLVSLIKLINAVSSSEIQSRWLSAKDKIIGTCKSLLQLLNTIS